MSEANPLYNLQQTAEFLGTSTAKVLDAINAGQLRAAPLGKFTGKGPRNYRI